MSLCILPPFAPTGMSLPPGKGDPQDANDRPTLPPIRHLFRDEFSRSQRVPESPSLTLARLRVSDNNSPQYPIPGARESPPYHYYDSPAQLNTLDNSGNLHRTRSLADVQHQLLEQSASRPPRSFSNDVNYQHVQGARGIGSSFIPHRNTVTTGDYRYDSRAARHPLPGRELYSHPTSVSSRQHNPLSSFSRPYPISTTLNVSLDEAEQTPVATHGEGFVLPSASRSFIRPRSSSQPEEKTSAKYECSYCGKGFNRPSSLKIHVNSHTGEKPFVCPAEGCGRSFSVLSNMRRHARVHTTTPLKEQVDISSDDGSEKALPPHTAVFVGSSTQAGASGRWRHHRRESSMSASSTSSRRSRSASSDEDDIDQSGRPEKRPRQFT